MDKYNVIAVGIVDLRGVPLPEAVGADPLIVQVIADNSKLLLDHSFRDGEYHIRSTDAVTQAVVFNVLLEHHRNSEDTLLAGLLLRDLQSVSVTVPDDIT